MIAYNTKLILQNYFNNKTEEEEERSEETYPLT